MVLLALLPACDTGDRSDRIEPDTTASALPPASTTTDTAQAGDSELRAALEQLLRGDRPRTPDEHTWFSDTTAGALLSATIDSAGHATVNFKDLSALIPNASTSAGSAMLLDELNRTVFGVARVQTVEYLIEGSCARFWEWLQYGCQTVTRPG